MQPVITIDLIAIYEILRPLALNILGITAYGVFIFNFYRFIARKDIIKLNLQKHNQAKNAALRKTISAIFYVFTCLLLYPVFVFFWFIVMAGLLYLLGRNHSTESVMLIAMGVVGAIRICSYYREALSTDISKILPFALLGIMIIDASLVNIVNTAASVREAALLWETMVIYLIAVVLIEFVLRMVTGLFGLIKNGVGVRQAAGTGGRSASQGNYCRVSSGCSTGGGAGPGMVYTPIAGGICASRGRNVAGSPELKSVRNGRESPIPERTGARLPTVLSATVNLLGLGVNRPIGLPSSKASPSARTFIMPDSASPHLRTQFYSASMDSQSERRGFTPISSMSTRRTALRETTPVGR